MDGIKEKSLRAALDGALLGALPSPWQGDGFWVRAIVLVRKRNFTESYALAVRAGDGAIRIKRDYGLPSQIFALLGVYPYEYLDERTYMYFPDLAGECALLGSYFKVSPDVFREMDKDELAAWARRRAVELQTRILGADMVTRADRLEEMINGKQED